ncbi:MAG: M23 family metallopeptidase [Agathobacter sp.]|nr:M23 family metallopeptidase [Agathobacter sp.]
MKKQHYVAAIACLIAGAIGFVSVYATEKAQERKQLAQQEQEQRQQETQVPEPSNNDDLSPVSRELDPKPSNEVKTPIAQKDPEVSVEEGKKDLTEPEQTEPVDQEKPVSKPAEQTVPVSVAETLHFRPENGIVWPLEGEVILDYSMDSTIFFPTLEQYRCNPAMVIAGAVNDKVFSVMRGKIIEVFNSEETGCTVRQDLGDGYIATYGQLKELNFGVGDIVESGQVIGYVSEPTKYYSVEGSNAYFSLKKDGNPVNPRDYLPIEEIDVPEQ